MHIGLNLVLIDRVRESYKHIFGVYLATKFVICCSSLCEVNVVLLSLGIYHIPMKLEWGTNNESCEVEVRIKIPERMFQVRSAQFEKN